MGYLAGMEKWSNYIIVPNIEEVIKNWNKNKNVKCTDVVNMLRYIYLVNWGSKIQTTTLETPNLNLEALHCMGLVPWFQWQVKCRAEWCEGYLYALPLGITTLPWKVIVKWKQMLKKEKERIKHWVVLVRKTPKGTRLIKEAFLRDHGRAWSWWPQYLDDNRIDNNWPWAILRDSYPLFLLMIISFLICSSPAL